MGVNAETPGNLLKTHKLIVSEPAAKAVSVPEQTVKAGRQRFQRFQCFLKVLGTDGPGAWHFRQVGV
jgi:hypothetical protein